LQKSFFKENVNFFQRYFGIWLFLQKLGDFLRLRATLGQLGRLSAETILISLIEVQNKANKFERRSDYLKIDYFLNLKLL